MSMVGNRYVAIVAIKPEAVNTVLWFCNNLIILFLSLCPKYRWLVTRQNRTVDALLTCSNNKTNANVDCFLHTLVYSLVYLGFL